MSNNKHGDAGKFSFARRRFLQNSAYAVGGLSFISPFSALLARAAESAAPDAVADTVDYLVEVADRNTGLPLLKLPEGFEYVSFGWTGDPLQDDFPTPGSHDGMAVIRSRAGRIVLARNHEIWGDEGSFGKESIVYDPRAGAGTTNLLFNAMTGELETSWISLGGTLRNCAGGPTPWGTWLTCEEIMISPGDIVGSDENARAPKFERNHGFIFEVKPRRGTRPEPLVDMGRFY
ncbi:MAG: PhoX family protein, partial [Gammaproteobacteria bacterium]|nr:PhoX family protein [Gammaproteobacteria bacterium]